jgi:hypothetical protein
VYLIGYMVWYMCTGPFLVFICALYCAQGGSDAAQAHASLDTAVAMHAADLVDVVSTYGCAMQTVFRDNPKPARQLGLAVSVPAHLPMAEVCLYIVAFLT